MGEDGMKSSKVLISGTKKTQYITNCPHTPLNPPDLPVREELKGRAMAKTSFLRVTN